MVNNSQSKRISSLVAIAMTIVLATGCASNTTTNTSSSTTTTAASTDKKDLKAVRVQLSFLKQSLDAPLIIAINKGYFAEEGLNVTYERGFGNADTISKLGTGKFDLAFSDMYNAMDFNDKNPNDKIIAVAVTQNKAPFAVLSFKQNGINSPKDLEGKKWGHPLVMAPENSFRCLPNRWG